MATIQVALDNWFTRNAVLLKTVMRVIFGIVWGIDGAFKFQPELVGSFPSMILGAGSGQPAWLAGWYSYWASTTTSNPALFVYGIGLLEVGLAFCLITGFLRKLAYTAGFFLSLLIWSVPEGFGGPYGPGSTDIGTGVIYAFVFVFLLLTNATYGTSRFSLDQLIEKRWPSWRRVAELRSGTV